MQPVLQPGPAQVVLLLRSIISPNFRVIKSAAMLSSVILVLAIAAVAAEGSGIILNVFKICIDCTTVFLPFCTLSSNSLVCSGDPVSSLTELPCSFGNDSLAAGVSELFGHSARSRSHLQCCQRFSRRCHSSQRLPCVSISSQCSVCLPLMLLTHIQGSSR
jgi:hypothetical protein